MAMQRASGPGSQRRRVLIGGAAALVLLFVVGAVVQVPRIESDLRSRVQSRLAADGFGVVGASFSGQSGTLSCTQPLDDPAGAIASAQRERGVRSVALDESCRPSSGGTDSTTTTTASSTTVAPTTVPPTTIAPTTTAATTTTVAPAPQFTVRLVDGTLQLGGAVANDLERLALVQRAQEAVAPTNVVDSLTVDGSVPPVPEAQFVALLDVMVAMPANLVTGELAWGAAITATAVYTDEATRARFEEVAALNGVTATLTPRATANAQQAADLEAELNALVFLEPILFDKGSTTISPASQATVQRVAGIAKRYAGLTIEVQGHTDSEGNPDRNLTLSEQRAASVLDALVALGVPAADLTSRGFGSTELVTDADGNELPELSRRVVFGVAVVA